MQNDGSISPVRVFFRSKWVRIILIIDILAVIVVIGVLIWNATKTATINFNVAPIDAKIQIDGRGEYYSGSYQVHPGNYTITISHDGLTTKTFNMDLKSGYSSTLTAFLSNNGNFDYYTYKNNYSSFEKLISIASKDDNSTTDHDTSAEQFIADFQHTLAIMDILPIKGYVYADSSVNSSTAGFAIRNGVSKEGCEMTACLIVNYYGKDYKPAVEKAIVDAGYNPADYQLLYERYN